MKTALYKQTDNINDWKQWKPIRGEIYLVNLGNDSLDCEQRGIRPAVIISNDIGNSRSSIVTIAPLTSKDKGLPIHVPVGIESGLRETSFILAEHIRTISKRRFFDKYNTPLFIGRLTSRKIRELEFAIKLSLGFVS